MLEDRVPRQQMFEYLPCWAMVDVTRPQSEPSRRSQTEEETQEDMAGAKYKAEQRVDREAAGGHEGAACFRFLNFLSLLFFLNLFIFYLFIFGCAGSSLLRKGFL